MPVAPTAPRAVGAMLQHISVRDFRNLVSLDIAVPESGLAIVGENGHGKTNLFEAVAYLRLMRSWRGARDADVVRFGAPAFHVRATLRPPAPVGTVGVGFERSTRRKRAALDGVDQTRLAQALGALPSVSFAPSDVALVAGGPGERRRYLDVALGLTSRPYLVALQGYRAALNQRNATLRELHRQGRGTARAAQGTPDDRVAVWEPALAEHGAELVRARRQWVHAHASPFAERCAAIGETQDVRMRYHGAVTEVTDDGIEEALRDAYSAQRHSEIRRGVTLVGPHRDDLLLQLGGRELRTFGSAGQQRTAAIALRMSESQTVQGALGGPPLLLLDDPFAELDARRTQAILALLDGAGLGQVLLAVPREEDIPPAFTRLDRRRMTAGVLS